MPLLEQERGPPPKSKEGKSKKMQYFVPARGTKVSNAPPSARGGNILEEDTGNC